MVRRLQDSGQFRDLLGSWDRENQGREVSLCRDGVMEQGFRCSESKSFCFSLLDGTAFRKKGTFYRAHIQPRISTFR